MCDLKSQNWRKKAQFYLVIDATSESEFKDIRCVRKEYFISDLTRSRAIALKALLLLTAYFSSNIVK